jgi:VWFA-related protein
VGCHRKFAKLYVFLLLLFIATAVLAGGQEARQSPSISSYCDTLASNASQSAALSQVCQFALTQGQQLPNVICSQETTRYRKGEHGGLKLQDVVTAEVSYADGKERYRNVALNGVPMESGVPTLSAGWSTGEFGGALHDVFAPQSMAEFKFSRKEVLRSTPVLIFEFHVKQQNNSLWHLQVGTARTFPGYSGSVWVNEATAHLMRLEMGNVEVEDAFPLKLVNSVIDYADVQLGDGTSFDLPVKSETLACRQVNNKSCAPEKFGMLACGEANGRFCFQNVLKFGNWRKFAATARILSDAGSQISPAPTVGYVPADTLAQLDLEENQKEYSRLADEMLGEERAATESEQRQTISAITTAQLERLAALMRTQRQLKANAPALDSAQNVPEGDDQAAATIKVNVKLVLVRVVARNNRGHAVGNLRKEDFQLFDNGKAQVISQFSVVQHETQEATTEAKSTDTPAINDVAASPQRYLAYLFDDVHLNFGDLAQARDAFERQLASLQSNDRAAIVTTSGKIVLDFTDDRAKLHQTADLLRPNPSTIAGRSSCPQVSYYLADLIENKHDPQALQDAARDAVACGVSGRSAMQMASAAARQQLAVGEQESRVSLDVLKEVVRGIATVPGLRNVVLVSSGFLTPDLEYEYSEIVDRAVHSQIVISALDARGVYVMIPGGDAGARNASSTSARYDNQAASAESDILAALADGTGGIFFHNSNDLSDGFRRVAGIPEYSYLLGFAPQNLKADGKFHALKVKLQNPQKLTIQARRGYYAPNRNEDPSAQAK